jgi:Class II Aldolase and Adducin N-terminal domain
MDMNNNNMMMMIGTCSTSMLMSGSSNSAAATPCSSSSSSSSISARFTRKRQQQNNDGSTVATDNDDDDDDDHTSSDSSRRDVNGYIISPGRCAGVRWSHVKPQDLVFYALSSSPPTSSSSTTNNVNHHHHHHHHCCLHAAIYKATAARSSDDDNNNNNNEINDDDDASIGAIVQWSHTPAATAVSCLQNGFVPMTHVAASYFYNKVARLESSSWNHPTNTNNNNNSDAAAATAAATAAAIQAAIHSVPGCNTLLLDHVGFCCFAKSVREAWFLAHCFEQCCEIQLRVMSATGAGAGGAAYKLPPTHVMEAAAAAAATSSLPESAPGASVWDALCKDFNFDSE